MTIEKVNDLDGQMDILIKENEFKHTNIFGGIPYTAHGAQISPPPYISLCFYSCFFLVLCLFLVMLWLGFSAGLGKKFS